MASKAPDPLPNPADPTPATPDTPFQALVDRFVDLDSTFADARKMSQPQIVPETQINRKTSIEPGKPGAEVSKKTTISQRKILPIECAHGDQPLRCPHRGF